MRVAVVTPTIGRDHLKQCLQSVQKQTYKNLKHYIFIDGKSHYDKAKKIIDDCREDIPTSIISLEDGVGGNGWNGHLSYAAASFLVDCDVICYLDDDNWIDPTHVEKLAEKIKNGNDWAYSLRKIYDENGNYICDDNCESLGKWPIYFNDQTFLVDTSCYAIKREVAVKIASAWFIQWVADRTLLSALQKYFPNYDCTNSYTTNYRLGGNANSVKKEFFEQGNAIMKERFNGDYPWQKTKLITVGPGISIIS
jgi:glycosyltransferase involved in cell wall biosynthesis